jgi:hypothetical protein
MIKLAHAVDIEARLELALKRINDLEDRVEQTENTLIFSGIVEEIDTTETVTLRANDPWAWGTKQYAVKKVK